MIITREVVNKNIVYHEHSFGTLNFNYSPETYNYQDLVNLIDGYKNLLIENGAKVNQTILVALPLGFNSLAAFIASSELGLGCVIVSGVKPKTLYCSDSKIKTLLPINYFLINKSNLNDEKYHFFSMICDKVIFENPKDFTENKNILATEKTVHHLCTSSGTSGYPKRIEHTHEFTYAVSLRNTFYMGKNIMIGGRPTHGSSLATFYVPSIISKNTENIYFGSTDDIIARTDNQSNNLDIVCDSLQIIYAERFEQIITKLNEKTNLTIFTLSAIRPEWTTYITNKKIKDIISLYGTSETSGPIMVQRGSDLKFAPDRFEILDDFYPVNIGNGTLETTIPVYNRYNNTQDIVEPHINGGIKLIGRKDLIRINDLIVSCRKYDLELNTLFSNATLTYDTLHNKIYLTVWYDEKELVNKIRKFSTYLKLQSEERHFISDYDRLEYNDFLSGIKLDHEMLRQYYRLKNENYKKLN